MILIAKPTKQVNQNETISFYSVHIINDGGLRASVTFSVKDEDGNETRKEQILYTGDEFNEFWTNFNSGKYLFEELKKKRILDVVIEDKIEDDFINVKAAAAEIIKDDIRLIDGKDLGEDILTKP